MELIKDYAKRNGISIQKVYAEARNGKLKITKKTEDGKAQKYVEEVTEEEIKSTPEQEPEHTRAGTPAHTDEKENELVDYLRKEVEELKAQVKEKDEKLLELSMRLADFVEDAQKIALQSQVLNALDKAQDTDEKENALSVEPKQNIFSRLFSRKKAK